MWLNVFKIFKKLVLLPTELIIVKKKNIEENKQCFICYNLFLTLILFHLSIRMKSTIPLHYNAVSTFTHKFAKDYFLQISNSTAWTAVNKTMPKLEKFSTRVSFK